MTDMQVTSYMPAQVAPAQLQPLSASEPSFGGIRRVRKLRGKEFSRDHVLAEVPVHLVGFCSEWTARDQWTPGYFGRIAPDLQISTKNHREDGSVQTAVWRLQDYARLLEDAGEDRDPMVRRDIPYCHDIPIFALIPGLARDCSPFPEEFLSAWYRRRWWKFAQFFLGPKDSLTPLHFDTLMTHNLFFQIKGRKRFTIIPPSQKDLCGRRGWRWFDVDPERPDFERFPQYRGVTPTQIIVGPGDVLYLPPGTLHHVRSLDTSISFNIDFHTRQSVWRALAAARHGMPAKNIGYNLLSALGVICGIPSRFIFRFYKSYLSYVS